MTEDRLKKSILIALRTAGIYASIFGACFLLLIFVAIATAIPDPTFAEIPFAVITATVKLLGVSDDGSAFTTSLFWTLIAFVLVFIFKLRMIIKSSDEFLANQTPKYTALIFVALFLLGILAIYNDRQEKISVSEEKRLALEFVKRDRGITGKNATVNLKMVEMLDNKPRRYHVDVSKYDMVNGFKSITAIVNVSHTESGNPIFTIVRTYENCEEPCKK